ncbi:unnamed protein product [Spirodela intermedia]|uniref:Uncharacterized protein n=1 Tax=Spirodela intermedia TaxID=51605 RepID=A0A7I8IXT6_SPIIN|nr:unnamed protein product [Spirodela intermedia]CAA6661820.1 unnamed protein product [Spirodela intermedia]
MEHLRQLKEVLLQREPLLLHDFVPQLAELQTGQPSPVRKFLAEAINDIGRKNMDLLPEMIPTLIQLLKDGTPAVARQAISSGTSLFESILEKLVMQGLHSGEIEQSLDLSWKSMLTFKDSVFPIAFQPGNDGVRLLAIKFIEKMILLYTPDPSVSSEPPGEVGNGFSISWVRGCNPALDVSDLATESSQSLGMLLDQLRMPHVQSLSNSIIIVLVNCLSAIAKKRPSFYGRVLPVLLALNPESTVIKGVEGPGAYHGLKSAFLTCLQCTHPAAAPWRPRLAEALKALNAGTSTNQPVRVDMDHGSISSATMEDKLSVQVEPTRKRSIKEEPKDCMDDDITYGKRARTSPVMSQEAVTESALPYQDPVSDVPQNNVKASMGVGDNGPIEQLVGTFGALVAQGDKAVQLLDILISSISSDLLAEVVMTNMRHLPPSCPKIDNEQEENDIGLDSSMVGGVRLLFGLHFCLIFYDAKKISYVDSMQSGVSTTANICGTADVPPSVSHSIEGSQSSIPGLGTVAHNEMSELANISQSSTSEIVGSSQGMVISSESKVLFETNLSGSMPTYVSETPSSSATLTDSGFPASTNSTSVPVSSQYSLPKMVAPVINLTDEQKDHMQKIAYMRIIEAYKHIAVAGGIQLRFALLACLGVEFPLELDAWGPLQKHMLEDYLNHDGHELTLNVLYRLYRESEQDKDFFSSTTAISAYETFLLTVAEALRDSFPASDKSLSRLLVEVPYLPKSVIKLLECMCSPESTEKDGRESQNGDRVTQGLSTVWSLILRRPSNRDICLKIALQSAVHHVEEVRMKAIRLVANKLFPMPSIAKKIEDFANDMLFSVVDQLTPREGPDSEGLPKSSGTQTVSSSSVLEAQRRMSLYFALCTKKHSLLQQLFAIYRSMPKSSKQAVHGHIPILVRTVGCSPDLLRIISELPDGCEGLLIQVLNTLADAMAPPAELLSSIRKLYESKLKDVEILIPIISSLSKHEVLPIFPKLVNLPLDKFQLALARILQGSPHSGPLLTPAEVLIAIHEVDPEKDGIPLKKVMDACSACFELRQVFTQQVFAKALNQLVEQIPLPLLFMRTVIQAIGVFPSLVDFIMEILSRLVNKQIWKYPKLWVGFLKCTLQTKPQSFGVLLQLPAAQLENALIRNPALKSPLVEHAGQPNIRSTLPRPTLAVLGLVSDPPPPPSRHRHQHIKVNPRKGQLERRRWDD